MVIGEKFAWGHLAKTGGVSTAKMFAALNQPDIRIDPDEWDWQRNEPFRVREAKTGESITAGRTLILGFRRLPGFMLSFAHFKKNLMGYDFTRDELIRGLIKHEQRDLETGELKGDGACDTHTPDDMLRYYEVEQIDRWIRVEHLVDDFIHIMETFYPITSRKKDDIARIHLNQTDYNRDIHQWFSKQELHTLYTNCPQWAELERRIYGGLITDD